MPDIQYLGHACFRLRGRDGIIVCDPFDTSVGYDMGRPTAHIVTVSHDHPDHNNIAAVRPARDQDVFVISGPGEYEVRNVLITGVRTYHDKHKGAERGFNTVYVIHIDDVVFCHLGDLGHELRQTQLEAIGSVDVLLVPVGGGETINSSEAASVISQIEPRMVIPMHYAGPQLTLEHQLDPIETFVHEIGLKDTTRHEKVSVTQANLPASDAEARVLLMVPSGA